VHVGPQRRVRTGEELVEVNGGQRAGILGNGFPDDGHALVDLGLGEADGGKAGGITSEDIAGGHLAG